MIDAFGGAFLIMIGLSYFIDYNKRIHWVSHVEPWLAKAGRFENFKVCLMLAVATILYFTVEPAHQSLILISSILGIMLHIGLELFGSFFHEDDAKAIKIKTGWAAFASLLYLEVLDASFSFDGVIGAFAKLFHLELPEWATGGLGLLFVSLAVGSSVLEARAIKLRETAAKIKRRKR